MRPELVIKTRSLAGSSDLTILAPIRPGLVPSLESVTYKTRVKRLLATLNTGRSSSHEYALLRPFSDAVERVGAIHSVRVAVVEPEDKILLAVTFDGPRDAYIRVLWQKVGALLDVIFCNAVSYVSAYDHSYEEWLDWAHGVQIESAFFYSSPNFTAEDVRYLKAQEWLVREHPADAATDLAATRYSTARVESVAWDSVIHGVPQAIAETAKLGLQSLAGLYRLTDLYLPSSEDGKYLHRAARELLLEFVQMLDTHVLDIPLELVKDRFEKQLAWLAPVATEIPPHGSTPPELPEATPPYDRGDVQGGIIRGYPGVTHGCLLLITFEKRSTAAAFLDRVMPLITPDDAAAGPGQVLRNVAFTCEGLRAIGLPEAELEWFSQEFREGMDTRAGTLGDIRVNHPRRWRLPVRNWPQPPADEPARVELAAVHAMLQLRVGTTDKAQLQIDELTDPNHPLHEEIRRLVAGWGEACLLSVQPMRRYTNPKGDSIEHFGFADGISQPEIDPPPPGTGYSNQVQLGEILLGYANQADHAPAESERMKFLRNGSYLVVRKLRQDVEALDEAVTRTATATGMQADAILAKMMGRKLDGTPLVPSKGLNDFDFQLDPQGAVCPFQAHIRRANPRSAPPEDVPEPPGRRVPRLMRRGMSYGPRYVRDAGSAGARENNAKERGLVFMAYNASIAEQFEVVQRWLNGGNSVGVFSGQSDPFMGVAANALPRIFRFENDGAVVRLSTDGWDGLVEDPKPIVRLEWGAYLFAPSLNALKELRKRADVPLNPPACVWSVPVGQRHIEFLQAVEQQQGRVAAKTAWKSALEDPEAQRTFLSASIWAAIRDQRHGGALRSPYGVIVADHDLAMRVLQDSANYSVEGSVESYRKRMAETIGEIYLGLDDSGPGGEYAQQSSAANAAINSIGEQEAFDLARKATGDALNELIEQAQLQAQVGEQPRWELNLDLREVVDKVLAHLCDCWFGVLETKEQRFKRGGTRWDWTARQAPYYPGNFTAPSRYIFQPNPREPVGEFGRMYGNALRKAMQQWLADHRAAGTVPADPNGKPARIGQVIYGPVDSPTPVDLASRTFVGVMMGFLPPADGNLRLILNEWLRDGTFWSLRAKTMEGEIPTYKDAEALFGSALCEAMQLRPSPELVWRTAKQPHDMTLTNGGNLHVEKDEIVVVSVVSATQQCLAEGKRDLFPIFGGNRDDPPHPTHACPGYKAAMGVIAGVLARLLEERASLRPSIAPVALVLDGPCPPARRQPPDVRAEVSSRRKRISRKLAAPKQRPGAVMRVLSSVFRPARATSMTLLALGDSWFHYKSGSDGTTNVVSCLRKRQYAFPVDPMGYPGMWLKEMAAAAARAPLRRALTNMLRTGQPPRAILLSGGGNDVVKTTLASLLNKPPVLEPIDQQKLDDKIGRELYDFYATILVDIVTVCDQFGTSVPVLVHPYDYPIPDGRLIFGVEHNPLSWLYPPIDDVRYKPNPYDLAAATKIMRRVIGGFQIMQTKLATDFANRLKVVVVPTAGTLDAFSANYKDYWENELHPDLKGFDLIGGKFGDELSKL